MEEALVWQARSGKVRCVTVDPHDSKRVYAGAEPIDVFVSDDLTQTWTRLDGVWDVPWVATVTYPVSTVEPHVRDVTIDPKDPNTIYAALQVGYIIKSTDGGETWKVLDKGVDCDVHTIVINPENTKKISIATGGHDSRGGRAPGRALYASDDGGETWSARAMDIDKEYSVPLVANPRNPNIMFSALAVGQPSVWRANGTPQSMMVRTKDGGQTWEHVGNGQPAPTGYPEAIAIDHENTDRVYAAFRTGQLHLSEDGGDTWELLDTKIPGGVASMKLVHA
jgi:photosystem II stability/assembly factor-like uncharacterized protein